MVIPLESLVLFSGEGSGLGRDIKNSSQWHVLSSVLITTDAFTRHVS